MLEILNKSYDELTDDDKRKISIGTGIVLAGLAGVCSYAIGKNVGFDSGKRAGVRLGYNQGYINGWDASGENLMSGIYKYNPKEFKEIMKMAQDNGFENLYNLCWKVLPDGANVVTTVVEPTLEETLEAIRLLEAIRKGA